MKPFQKRTWAEIDLQNVKDNFLAIKNKVNKATKICCIVKANAYGHGAYLLARVYQDLNADYLAVSNIEEALQLRHHNIILPILILGYTDPECAGLLSVNNITQCVFSKEYGKSLSDSAIKENVDVKIHIKLDTGMGRIGFRCKDENMALSDVVETCNLPNLIHEGIFTHFASADEGENGDNYTKNQFNMFKKAVEELEKKGLTFDIKHCANSATILDYPEMQMDMVRAGIVLYGLNPSNEVRHDLKLKPVMELKSVVDHIKEVMPGDAISYGRKFVASKKMRVATIPVGYADGLFRSNSTNGLKIEVCGKFAPILGRICMDQMMIDISDIDDCKIGTVATIYGKNEENSVDRVASLNGTINYEILCALGERVPRIYLENGKIVSIVDNIVGNVD